MSECLILFGIDDNIKTDSVFLFHFTSGKNQCLYKCKMENNQTNINIFRRKLLSRYKIEYNAVINCSCTFILPGSNLTN